MVAGEKGIFGRECRKRCGGLKCCLSFGLMSFVEECREQATSLMASADTVIFIGYC